MTDRQPRRLTQIMLAVLLASALLLPPPAGPSAPAPALAQTTGSIYVVDSTCCAGGKGGVIRVDPATGAQTIVAEGGFFTTPYGIAIAANGDLMVVDGGCCAGAKGGVIKVNPVTGAQSIVSEGNLFGFPTAIAIGASGDLFVTDPSSSCCGGGTSSVIRVNPMNGAQESLVTPVNVGANLLSNPRGIAVAANGDLFVGNTGGAVIRVDPTTGNQDTVSSAGNFANVMGVAVAANGDPIVADSDCCDVALFRGAIIQVDAGTGGQTVVSSLDKLADPFGVAVAANGNVLVADAACCVGSKGGIFRVNLTTGVQTIVSEGDKFTSPWAVAVAPVLSVDSPSVGEGGANLTFTVSLAPHTSLPVTVQYATSDGTAQAGSDYTAASGTLTFTPGQTSKTVVVPLVGDVLDEANETVLLTLSNPSAATLAQPQATGTIQDDDPAPTLSIAGTSVPEGNSGSTTATFTATLSAASGQTVTVQYATSDGTAQAGSDYTATSGTLTFTPGQTSQPIAVQVTGDTTFEPDETFSVTLSTPVNATIATGSATGTIQNDDTAPTATLTPTPTLTSTATPTSTLSVTATPTSTLSVTTTPTTTTTPLPCSPRPGVTVETTQTGPGILQARLRTTPLNGGGSNTLSQVQFQEIRNARVVLNGAEVAVTIPVPMAPGTTEQGFIAIRATSGHAAHIAFEVTDQCGVWRSFVGMGTGIP